MAEELEAKAMKVNEATVRFCRSMLEEFGGGNEYRLAIGAAATALLFHAFRLELPKSKEKALELVGVLLGDVAINIQQTSGLKIKFKVEEA